VKISGWELRRLTCGGLTVADRSLAESKISLCGRKSPFGQQPDISLRAAVIFHQAVLHRYGMGLVNEAAFNNSSQKSAQFRWGGDAAGLPLTEPVQPVNGYHIVNIVAD
jgi:hypothetical protein